MARKKKEAAESADTKMVHFMVSFPAEIADVLNICAALSGHTRSEFLQICVADFTALHSDEYMDKLKRLKATLSK